LSSVPAAQPNLGLAFAGGFLVALSGGGAGLLAGAGHFPALMRTVPPRVRAAVLGGVCTALLVFSAGGVLVAASVGAHLTQAASVLSHLHADSAGSALYAVVVASAAPNAALF